MPSPASPGSWAGPPPSRWMSGGPAGSSPPPNEAPWRCVMAAVSSRGVPGPWSGAKATTWSTGWTAARPTWPTWSWCAGPTIGPSMRAAGGWPAGRWRGDRDPTLSATSQRSATPTRRLTRPRGATSPLVCCRRVLRRAGVASYADVGLLTTAPGEGMGPKSADPPCLAMQGPDPVATVPGACMGPEPPGPPRPVRAWGPSTPAPPVKDPAPPADHAVPAARDLVRPSGRPAPRNTTGQTTRTSLTPAPRPVA